MAKELPFFKFEISEWMFGRIQKMPLEIQGTFINLCCKYWHKLGEMSLADSCLDFDQAHIKTLMDKKIVGQDSEYIFIKFLDIQLDECEQHSKKQRIKGLKSAEVRATRKQQQSTTVQPRLTSVQPNSTEEKRREDISHNYDFNKTFADLTNTPYSLPAERGMDPVGRTTDEVVMQLRKTGFSEGEIYARTRAMKSVYRKQKLTFPSRPETFIISFTAKDWIKELTGMDPEIAAEQFQKNLKDETRRTEPDTIGSSEPGSLE